MWPSVRRQLKREDGFSLVEMVVASAILLVSVAVILNSFVTGNIVAKRTGKVSIATNLAQRKLERLKNKSYGDVGSESETSVGSDYPGFNWSVTVSYVERSADGTYSVSASDKGLKKVVVKVSWSGDGVNETQVSAILANRNLYGTQGGVSGKVYGADGTTPVSGATVSSSDGLYSGITSTNGSWSINNLIPGTYSLYATKSGYNTSPSQSVSITAGTTTTNVNFQITNNPGSISGTIFHGATTATISGVSIVTSPGGYSATSGLNGSYTISGILPGDYAVTATASGYQFSRKYGITVTGGGTISGTDFQLQANTGTPVTGTITGTIYAAGGSKIGGATINTVPGNYTATSNNNAADPAFGTYSISDVIPGTYTVSAVASGYVASQVSGIAVTAGNTVVADITLKGQVGTLRGRVTNQAENPVQGVRITVLGTAAYGLSNPDGYYSIFNVPAGTYSVTASQTSPSKSQTVGGIEIVNAQTTYKDFNTKDFN